MPTILYSFFNVGTDGSLISVDNWADYDNPFIGTGVEPQNNWSQTAPPSQLGLLGQFMKLRQQGKLGKFLLSIGGWTLSSGFSAAWSTQEGRRKTIQDFMALIVKYTSLFTGIDVDWETPGIATAVNNSVSNKDGENLVLFFKELREALTSAGMSNIELSFAAPANIDNVKFDCEKLGAALDTLNLMTYSFSDGAWGDKITAHSSNLYDNALLPETTPFSVDKAVKYYISKGFPANKICIGGVFNTQGFKSDGLGQVSQGAGPDIFYYDVAGSKVSSTTNYYTYLPYSGASEYLDTASMAAYSYDPIKKSFLSYDNQQSMQAKIDYIYKNGLKGLFIWEASGDKRALTSARSLYNYIYQNLIVTPPSPAVYNLAKPGDGTQVMILNNGGGTNQISMVAELISKKNGITTTMMPPIPTPSTTTTTSSNTTSNTSNTTQNTTVNGTTGTTSNISTTPTPTDSETGSTIPNITTTVNINSPVPWSEGVQYVVGQVVIYNSRIYVTSMAHTSYPGTVPDKNSILFKDLGEYVESTTLAPSTTGGQTTSSTTQATTSTSTTQSTTSGTSTTSNNTTSNPTTTLSEDIVPCDFCTTCRKRRGQVCSRNPNAPTTTMRPTTTVSPSTTSQTSTTGPQTTSIPVWQANVMYMVGNVVKENGVLYRVLQQHTSQSTWPPSQTPALFTRI